MIDIVDPSQADGTTAPGWAVPTTKPSLVAASPDVQVAILPEDEWQALALNYTSGTSGQTQGCRLPSPGGSYLMSPWARSRAWQAAAGHPTVSLYVVPMFHCNGWNHPWAAAIVGARMVFTRDPAPDLIFAALATEGVTHLGAAPIVLATLAESDAAPAEAFDPPIRVMTAGAPPPPAILARTRALGFDVMQVYGLTETYGHISQCLWRDEWDDLTPAEQAEMQAMQGVAFPMVEEFAVIDRTTGNPVPKDGETQGEIAIRANTVMKGYYKDPDATAAAFDGGRFWSGDAAVVRDIGYAQIRDRLKDVIISGGENISSVEVENILHQHEAVQSAAVVARPHPKWGEAPCAFVELRPGSEPTEDDIITFCRDRLAGFKTPKSVVFGPLPKTATGKIQKYILRDKARTL